MIRFDKAVAREVRVGSVRAPILMAGDVDELIDDYVAAQGAGAVPADRSPFGAVLWPSGRAFVRWWDARRAAGEGNGAATPKRVQAEAPERAYELGCGVGLVSAYFAAAGAREVVATDYEPSLEPFVRANARAVCAAHGAPDRAGAVSFATLDWTVPLPEDARGRERFLVATDVLYENVHVEFLPRIGAALLHPDGVFYLADPERYRWRAARENILAAFADVVETTVDVENDEDDASKGVVDTGTTLTRVRILACRGPRAL